MLDGSEIKAKFGARWAFSGTQIWTEIEGDNILPFIEWDGGKKLKAIELLGEHQARYEAKLIDNFRWVKGICFEKLIRWEEMDAKHEFWRMETEQNGLQLEPEYFEFAQN